jgi:hypothetical protein
MVEEQQVNSVIWIAKAAGLWLISALFPPLELGVVLEQIRARFSEKDVARGVTKRERERSTFRLGIGITLGIKWRRGSDKGSSKNPTELLKLGRKLFSLRQLSPFLSTQEKSPDRASLSLAILRGTFRLGIGITLCKSITVAILREACTNTLCYHSR